MSDDKKSKVSDKASEIARNVWLAGLGAYGKALDEAQGKKGTRPIRRSPKETPELFRDLVKKGSELEEEARESLEELRESSASAVEARIKRVRKNFNIDKIAKPSDLETLSARVQELEDAVGALVDALKTLGGLNTASSKKTSKRKPAAKKPAAKKPAAKKAPKKAPKKAAKKTARKAPAKKPAAKKSPAKKPVAKKAAAKKTTAKKAPAKKAPARKKAVVKKAAAQKATTKKKTAKSKARN